MSTYTTAAPILLVAGERVDARIAVARTLRSLGLPRIDVTSSALVVDAALRVVPDVLLLLADPPFDRAADAVRQLRTHAAARLTPILVRVGAGGQTGADTLLMAGADAVVPETTDGIALFKAVARLGDATPPARVVRELRRALSANRPNGSQTDGAALRARFARLTQELQQFNTGLAAADSQARCLAVNSALCGLTGATAGELMGRPLWELTVPGLGRDLHAGWSTCLLVGAFDGRCGLRRMDGRTVIADVHAAAHVLPNVHVAAFHSSP